MLTTGENPHNSGKCSQLWKMLSTLENAQLSKTLTTLENVHNWKCSQLSKMLKRSQLVKMLTTGENTHNWWKCSQHADNLRNAHNIGYIIFEIAYDTPNKYTRKSCIHPPTTQDKAPSSELIIRRPHGTSAIEFITVLRTQTTLDGEATPTNVSLYCKASKRILLQWRMTSAYSWHHVYWVLSWKISAGYC